MVSFTFPSQLVYFYLPSLYHVWGFPCGAVVKNPPANAVDARDVGSIPWSEGSLGGGNGNPLQSSCPENSMDREAWRATVHGVLELDTTEHACTHAYHVCWCPNVSPFENLDFFFYCWVLSSLYILDTGPLLDMWFAGIFSHSVAYTLILLMVCLTEQTLKFFSFVYNALGLMPKN